MTRPTRRLLRQSPGMIIGALISALCIWLVLSRIQWSILLETIGSVDPVWIGVALGLNALRIASLVWRWHFLLASQGSGNWRLAFESLAVGYSANTLLPMRAGDAARLGGVAHFSRLPLGRISAAMVLERVGDGFILLLLAGVSLLFLPDRMMELIGNLFFVGQNTLLFGGAFIVLIVVGVVFFRLVLRNFFPDLAAFFLKLLADLKAGLGTARSPRMLMGWFGLSLLTWIIEVATYFAVLRGLALGISLPGSLVACTWGSLVVMIPSAPGGFGSFELALQTLLSFYGINPSEGLAASLLIHTIVLLPITLIGAIWIPKWVRSFTGETS